MEFYTQDSSGSEITSPRMTITNKGNVGVGVSTPMSTFEVYGNVAANAFMVDGSNISNVWVNSNDYATLLAARSNDYNSYTTLQSNIDTVQDNLASVAVSITAQTIITSSSASSYTMSQSVDSPAQIFVFLDGIAQVPTTSYVVSGTTLTLNNTTPIPSGLYLDIRYF